MRAGPALAAGPIAGRLGAPLLTTEQATLSEAAAGGILAHAPELEPGDDARAERLGQL